jgi:SOS response regulatory protein OraA/RecX
VKKPSEKSLTNVALHALRKHSTSRRGLVQKLERKLVRSGEVGPAEAKLLIEQVVERMTQAGYLDDTRMAESKTASLQRQGKSSRVIEMKLREKGIDPALAKTMAITTPEREFESACLLVKKKRLGIDPDRKQKDFAVLMRAGFSSDVARRALREAQSDPGEMAQVIHLPRAQTSLSSIEGDACEVLSLPLPSLPSLPRRPLRPESGLEAASALVEKKRLGLDPGRKQRDLGVLVRAGFSFDIAKQALLRIGK